MYIAWLQSTEETQAHREKTPGDDRGRGWHGVPNGQGKPAAAIFASWSLYSTLSKGQQGSVQDEHAEISLVGWTMGGVNILKRLFGGLPLSFLPNGLVNQFSPCK